MNSIDEKNNEILENALSNAAKINNKDFSDDIEDDISLKLIKKIAEIEISKIKYGSDISFDVSIFGIKIFKIENGFISIFGIKNPKIKYGSDISFDISIFGIIFAFLGIGLSEITLGISLLSSIKDISYLSWYYIKLGIIIIFSGIVIARLVMFLHEKVNKEKLQRLNFFQHVILKIERRLS